MARYSTSTATTFSYDFWLVFDDIGGVRLTRGEPDLQRGEHKIFMRATLPKSLWQRPQLRGSIVINDAGQPGATIDVQAAQDAVRSATGLDIDIQVIAPEPSQ